MEPRQRLKPSNNDSFQKDLDFLKMYLFLTWALDENKELRKQLQDQDELKSRFSYFHPN